jgi:hypothetical protein
MALWSSHSPRKARPPKRTCDVSFKSFTQCSPVGSASFFLRQLTSGDHEAA